MNTERDTVSIKAEKIKRKLAYVQNKIVEAKKYEAELQKTLNDLLDTRNKMVPDNQTDHSAGNSLNVLPQEIVYEIIKFVPEYGYRVNRFLHKCSKNIKVSAYCDFRRYRAAILYHRYVFGINRDHLNHCRFILKGRDAKNLVKHNVGMYETFNKMAKDWIKKNAEQVVIRYICGSDKVIDDLIEIVINNSDRVTKILFYDKDRDGQFEEWMYNCIVRTYAKIILVENDMGSADDISAFGDIDPTEVIEVILSVYHSHDHIFTSFIRYFPDHAKELCRKLKTYTNDKRHDHYYFLRQAIKDTLKLPRPDWLDKKNMMQFRSYVFDGLADIYGDQVEYRHENKLSSVFDLLIN